MCFFFVFLLLPALLLAFALWLARGRTNAEGVIGSDLRGAQLVINVGGIGLALASFFFLPWVKFAPADYVLGVIPEMIEDVAPDAISTALSLLGHRTLAGAVRLMDSIGGLPGWAVLIFVLLATLFVSKAYLPLLIAMLLLPVSAVWTLGWLSASQLFSVSPSWKRSMARIQVGLAAFVALLLLFVIPSLDTLSPSHDLALRLLVMITGMRMSAMVWLGWVGMLFLVIGGLWAYFSAEEPS